MNRTKIIVVQIIFENNICKITFFSLARSYVCDTLVSLRVIKSILFRIYQNFYWIHYVVTSDFLSYAFLMRCFLAFEKASRLWKLMRETWFQVLYLSLCQPCIRPSGNAPRITSSVFFTFQRLYVLMIALCNRSHVSANRTLHDRYCKRLFVICY